MDKGSVSETKLVASTFVFCHSEMVASTGESCESGGHSVIV